jgi:hypothetical protein
MLKLKSLTFIALLALAASTASARIGYTLKQCRSLYGREIKTETAWCGGKAYSFIKDELYIYAIIPEKETRVADITYFDNTAQRPLSSISQETLWKVNQFPGTTWDFESPFHWNGRIVHKRLGQENYEHWVECSLNLKYTLIANRSKLGWQIRTQRQFNHEQRVIKQMTQEVGTAIVRRF